MRDYRNRPIQYQDGKRVFHKPVKPIERCFDIEDISWEIYFTSKIDDKPVYLKLASGTRERQFKQENKELFIFN